MITCRCDVCTSADVRNRRLRASLLLEWAGSDGKVAKVLVDTATDLRQQALRAGIDRSTPSSTRMPMPIMFLGWMSSESSTSSTDSRFRYTPTARPLPRCEECSRTHSIGCDRRTALTPVEIGDCFDLLGVRVEAIALPHGSGSVRAFRIGDFAYATDCNEIPADAAARLRGLDVLVIDALRQKPHRSHFTVEQALEQVATLQPRQAYLTHLSHDLEHAAVQASLPDGVAVAHDELTIELPLPERSRCV